MAEVYGEKPKAFSKEWWPYFWEYYRWHTIGILLALFMVAVTAVQCAQREEYDITVNYVGLGYIPDETVEKLELSFEELAPDIDGNGEVNVFFQQINIGIDDADAELAYAMQTKHDIGLMEDTSHLYIYAKDQAELMIARDNSDDLYTPVEEWFDGELDASSVIESESGTALAMSLKDSTFMDGFGIIADDMYVAIKLCNPNKEDNIKSYNCAVEIAQTMIK